MPVALITGGSAGLGRALATALAGSGWDLVLDARHAAPLAEAVDGLAGAGRIIGLPGDVADPVHRGRLADAVTGLGRLDLLVNNASTLGPTPLPALAEIELAALDLIYEVNVLAPLGLIQLLLPTLLRSDGVLLSLSSDAAVASYPGWGGYGSAKAALDHLTATLAAEQPGLHCYAVDPGDMRTAMQQAAFPGQDISDRPLPESVLPGLLELLASRPASGRYRATDFGRAAPDLPKLTGANR
ncbi:MAG: SDR family NAD(P)-dependent oxidoreductase [Jatrophihabitans sp.]